MTTIEWIFFIVFNFVSIGMLTTGISLLKDWNNRMQSWKSAPSIRESISCLLDGLCGCVGLTTGFSFLAISVFSLMNT